MIFCDENVQGGGAVVQCSEGAAEGHEEPAETSWWQFQKTGEGGFHKKAHVCLNYEFRI